MPSCPYRVTRLEQYGSSNVTKRHLFAWDYNGWDHLISYETREIKIEGSSGEKIHRFLCGDKQIVSFLTLVFPHAFCRTLLGVIFPFFLDGAALPDFFSFFYTGGLHQTIIFYWSGESVTWWFVNSAMNGTNVL